MSDPEDVIWVPETWAKAWEVYTRHGNQKGAMKELKIGAAVLRRRLKGYAEWTGQELPSRNRKPPAKLSVKHIAAWEALERLNNYEEAAADLGIHRNSLRLRLATYRRLTGLAVDARPRPKEISRKPRPVVTIEERLDVLLIMLERAQAAGDRHEVATLRESIATLERCYYGSGVDP